MPLRCLLFSSNEELVQPIWQVLAGLGIEGEYCQSAVDAVERVTTQLFQIVITDWDDQPEAAFLLKTARDLKAAQRPLTLAIVSDAARLPEALQAGANSVLLKPIRAEQVRDTMSTACQLLRAKQQPGAQPAVTPQPATQQAPPQAAPRGTPETALAAAASTSTVSLPNSVSQAPEKTFRAGGFLQSSGSAPGGQFDTECEIHKSMNQAAGAEVDALTELEPTAAAVEAPAAPEPEPQEPLTGWASLQARLTRTAPQPAAEAPAKSELLSYGETPSHGSAPAEPSAEERKAVAQSESQPESGSEAALFAYISGEAKEPEQPAPEARSKLLRVLLMGALAAAGVVLVAVPQARQRLQGFYRNSVRAGGGLLNPAPAPVPQAAVQHDSFGQSGDEYKLPVAGNIPDATTDPSQIRVVPVVDPTAKPEKNAEANSGQAQATAGANNVTDSNQPGASQPGASQPGASQPVSSQAGQVQAGDGQVKDPALTSVGEVPGNTAGIVPSPVASPVASPAPPALQVQQNPAVPQASAPQLQPVARPVQNSAPRPAPSPAGSSSIPSSLKSQIASMTPDSSGAKPVEAAMSSIEPVNLPESAAWELLAQPVDPVYPAAAKASGQRGSVVLQVLIGRDGTVQDAKFLQGSLVFARAAIDAVKQWRFKPYTLNGRAVSVQSVITLNFKPPA